MSFPNWIKSLMGTGRARGQNRLLKKRRAVLEALEGRQLLSATLFVDDSNSGIEDGSSTSPYNTIQEAVNVAANGDTIQIAAGNYAQPVNIQGRSGLSLIGAGRDVVKVRPATTLAWYALGQTTGRKTAFRVVDSTNITVQGLTLDLDLVKANQVYGTLWANSSGTFAQNTVENASIPDTPGGGYYEFGAYVRALSPAYTAASRAEVTFSGNDFKDTGRVGIIVHDNVDVTIDGNHIYKTTDDFGYGIELGSSAIGSITGNTIHGYDTPAASDESTSAGIYIENAFTYAITSPGITKTVTVSNNEVYDSQWAMTVGNQFNGFAGNVDIVLEAEGNNFHDNVDGAVILTDEDASVGSSVTATFSHNTLSNNGKVGYFIYTIGDGNVAATIQNDTISGHEIGVFVGDYSVAAPGTYAVQVNFSDITDNDVGVWNDTQAPVDAQFNWWSGNADGDALGSVDATPALLASVFSGNNLIFSGAGRTLLVNTQTGDFELYEDDVLTSAGTGARVQSGVLKIHEIDQSGKKIDVTGAADGTITLNIRGKNKTAFALSRDVLPS